MESKGLFRDLFVEPNREDKFFALTNPLFWVYIGASFIIGMVYICAIIAIEEAQDWWFLMVKVRGLPKERLANWEANLNRLEYKTRYEMFKKRITMKIIAKRLSA